jgi:hypothetical protein
MLLITFWKAQCKSILFAVFMIIVAKLVNIHNNTHTRA